MRSSTRRLLYVAGLAAAVWASQRWWRARTAPPETMSPATPWPPVPVEPDPPRVERTMADPHPVGGIEPDAGRCPDDHPVKAKLRSGIYHLPGMALYDRTVPDRCYRSAEQAEADGFRRAKH